MFGNTSKGGWGMAGFIVFGGLSLMGFDIATLGNDLSMVTMGQAVSTVLWIWGQMSRGDLKFGLLRK